jgi:hypothetical protein
MNEPRSSPKNRAAANAATDVIRLHMDLTNPRFAVMKTTKAKKTTRIMSSNQFIISSISAPVDLY